ncbi:chaperone protein DNAJ [Trypanosoma rangeli]|uniref:Chaperone protein DNAJ n=1 Tax=Trypanosoma rangeli TaxID=5698 RepID=A0A3R7LVM9_TRYRA|nr:chaperone protein DNAJ [Trypanosoma rangeli]RNF04155.1 chaperone protein DNAJ [Trypanosoma rangeli]|eukprot:RNF04155.1 chaperone protein DNAJ [Trypanosoma rangeli]
MPPLLRGGAGRVGISASSALASMRRATTGEHHSYRPGRLARVFRRLYVFVTPRSFHKSLATNLQVGMERVQELEREQLWLRQHGSPLRVMGLPEHAELTEVRSRYRDLVFATHPDTAEREAKTQYDMIQTAYKMATTPTSLWHQNGSAPALYRSLRGTSKGLTWRVDCVTLFALFSYAVMGTVGIIFSLVVVRQFLELALRFFDPEFYAFLVAQEKEEERQRLAGISVDTDPKRLAPTVVKRLLFPGRFVHNNKGGGNEAGKEADE